jgi:cis-3-alkyl-4-acyloxetan-2-one decarboxylase
MIRAEGLGDWDLNLYRNKRRRHCPSPQPPFPMPSRDPPATDWLQLYPFKSHWTDFADGRMHYVDEGPAGASGSEERNCLLFVHGNPTWSFHWRRLIVALRDRYRCVAPDHLGCGLSDKPRRLIRLEEHINNLATLVKRLHADRVNVTLIAQDWGGAIGLGAMDTIPGLTAIVLFNTGAWPPTYVPWRIRACQLPVLGRLAVQGGNLFSRAALRMTLSRKRSLDPAVAAGYLAPYDNWSNRQAVYGFVRDIPTNEAHPTWHMLERIELALPSMAEIPSALVWGMRDWCFRPDCLRRFQAVWPNAEVHELADVGHWVVEDSPDESLILVERFLRRVEDARSGVVESITPISTTTNS